MDQHLPRTLNQHKDKQSGVAASHRAASLPNVGRFILVLLCASIGLSDCAFAQSGNNSPMPAIPRRERGKNVRLQTSNIQKDQSNLIADVVIRGNQLVPTHYLTRNLGTRPGRYFDPDLLRQDVDRLWRMPEIRRLNGPFIDQTQDGLVVTIEVVERNLVQGVEFIGNRGIADRTLKKESGLEDGQPADVHEIRMAKTRLEEYYKEKGYPRTQIEIVEGDQVEDHKVVFLIHEDQKQKVWKTDFIGNSFASDARLQHFIKSKPALLKMIGGVVNREEIDQDILRLEGYYKSFGFFNVRIGRELAESNDGRWMTIRFIIDEGPRYKIRNVSFIGNNMVDSNQLGSLVELRPDGSGMPDFNSAKMNSDVVALRDLYGSQGFMHVQVDAEPRFLEEPGIIDLVYRVDEGKQYRVGKINVHIEGDNGITRREVVLNRLSLRPGQLVDVREIRNSERRLGSAQIFSTGPQTGGTAPKIVVRPPELQALERTANGANGAGSGTRSSGGSGTRYR